MKRLLGTAAAMLISVSAYLPLQASAQVSGFVAIQTAPPPPRHEVIPVPRQGYAWAPGYWNWNGHKHVWMAGHWERARNGQIYHPAAWHQGSHGWEFDRGGWQPGAGARPGDRDGDGAPNHHDDHPDNPRRN